MKKNQYRIELTRVGYLFIALCLGIGIAALNTGNNLLYLTFGMMLSFIILSGILSQNTLYEIYLTPRFPKRIYAKTPLAVRYLIENKKNYFPSYAINVFPATSDSISMDGAFVLKIPPRGSQEALSRIIFPKRGHHPLPGFRVETSYPFGFLKKFMIQSSKEETLVYPSVFPIQPKTGLENQYLGELLSGQRGESGNPYGIRQFVFGDPYRYIHWKSSAKKGELRIKEFENEKRMSLEVDLRLDSSPQADSSTREIAISIAASLVIALKKKGIDIFLRINGSIVNAHLEDEMLSALALCEPSKKPFEYKNITRQGQAIVVSDLSTKHLPSDVFLTISRERFADYI
ncbi:MAG: DUF58 domain-containing protein [Bdellovibrionales bacterium]|nr:DUF58 domain-containing protein [Bdellovibrionales bacterium]